MEEATDSLSEQLRAAARELGGWDRSEGSAPAVEQKKLSLVEMIEWALEHLDDKKVKGVGHAPCPGAWSLLEWGRDNKKEFMGGFVAKLIPSRSQLEMAERIRDDGRDLSDRISEIRRLKDQDTLFQSCS